MMSFHVRRNALRSISALSSLTRLQLSLVHRLSAFSSTSDSAHLSGTLSDTKRTYATRHASRPKAHTGRTTSPTRTRKAATALPSTSTSSTEKSDAKPKSSKTKKVQAKSGRKPKRELSENGKIRAEKRKKTELRQELKKIALSPPKKLPESVWSIVMQELVPGAKGLVTKEASSKYKSLSTAELEHYNHIKNQNKAANAVTREAWINSLTPDDIRRANNARRQLKGLGVKAAYPQIKDTRQVKRPATAHGLFLRYRYASGDMEHIKTAEAMNQIMREWKDLPSTDKSSYMEEAAADRQRYFAELKTVYGREAHPRAPAA